MKFPKLGALVPKDEHFDETAINGEGVWLSVAHTSALEKAISDSEIAIVAKDATIKENADAYEALTASLATEKETVATLTTTNATQATRITELEAEVATLGKKASGTGTPLTIKKDESAEVAPVPVYLNDHSPENEWLDKQMQYRSKPKA